jgi:signal transduction histidine kinase
MIVKEAINNALKHSGGSCIQFRIEALDEGMRLEITDNGMGLHGVPPVNQRNGLANMTHRAQSLGGNLQFEGGKVQGAIVSAFIPWPEKRSR